jgi:FkbM family methyltransferase
MNTLAKLIPAPMRPLVRGWHHQRQMKRGQFRSPEPEWDRLAEWVKPGMTVLDIGANVGHYTLALSRLVGETGRVIAFEPVPETFAALAANSRRFPHRNVTLMNAAVGAESCFLGLEVPQGRDGTYLAHLDPDASLKCLVLSVDCMHIPGPVGFIKMDAEGHEPQVLQGMAKLIGRDRPVVMLERNTTAEAWLEQQGYTITTGPTHSPNCIAIRTSGS